MNIQEFKKNYGLNTGDPKWIINGGDLLRYVGMEVVYIDYKKDKTTGEWSSRIERAIIKRIDDFDPITMTYHILYDLLDSKQTDLEERIIPEGYSFDIMGQGIQDSMNRFTPYSYHLILQEEDLFYKRLLEGWDINKTLPFEALKTINENKEKSKLLKYAKNIVALIRPFKDQNAEELEYSDEVLQFRIFDLILKHEYKEDWRLMIKDRTGKSFNLLISEKEEDSYEFKLGKDLVGDLKIIDLEKWLDHQS